MVNLFVVSIISILGVGFVFLGFVFLRLMFAPWERDLERRRQLLKEGRKGEQ